MGLSQRYKQAAKEARWALGLVILYVFVCCVCAYLPKNSSGPIGFRCGLNSPAFIYPFCL